MNNFSPFASETRKRLAPDPVALALAELQANEEAVALAKVCAVARQQTAYLCKQIGRPGTAASNVCVDSFALCRDELDNLIFEAAVSNGLERSDLPSTGELVDGLCEQNQGVAVSSHGRSAAPSGLSPCGSQAEPAATNARKGRG
jgi:hypothetical protein